MRKIAYTTLNDRLIVVTPVINTGEELSEADAELRAFSRLPSEAIDARFIDADKVPTDRTFRNAWKVGLNGIEVDARLKQLRYPSV